MNTQVYVPLNSISLLTSAEIGGKSFSIAQMMKAGIPVPDSIVIPTAVYAKYYEKVREHISLRRSNYNDISLEQDLIQQAMMLLKAYQPELLEAMKFLDQPLAVRSSALCEDSKEDSWAGIFDSYLNIQWRDINYYIALVWLSTTSVRSTAYLQSQATSTSIKMAVLIQRMINAVVAGTSFSVDPVTADPDYILVEAVSGSGTSLMSGGLTPSRFEICKHTLDINQVSFANAIDDQLLRNLANLTLEIEALLNCPVDVEWAADQDKLWILQARPITRLGF